MLGAKDFGIDLGTNFIRIYTPGSAIITEPNIIVFQRGTESIAAIGTRAEKLLSLDTERYMQLFIKENGALDYTTARETLGFIVRHYQPFSFLLHPDLLMAIPHGSSVIERKAIRDLCIQAGFNEKGLYFIDELLAAAIGAGLPVLEPVGTMVINIGGGNTQAGVFSLGGLVCSGSLHKGGRELSRQIVEYVRKQYGIMIDITTAQRAKLRIGSLLPQDMEIDQVTLNGRNMKTGMPDSAVVTTEEMREAIRPVVNEMVDCIYQVLEQTPPELASDLIENGVIATGGAVQMRGLLELIEERTHLNIKIAKHTSDAVIRGVQKVMQDPSAWNGVYSDLLQ